MRRALATPALLVALGCARDTSGDFWLLLAASSDSGVRLADAEVTPSEAVVERRTEPDGVALLLRRDRGPVRVSAPFGCPIVVEAPFGPGPVERRVEPLFDFGPTVRVVGPERRFEVRARERCDEAKRASVEFRVTGGAQLDDVRLAGGGRALSATTRGAAHLARGEHFGIVPVSFQARGATQLAARVRLGDGSSFEKRLEVAALARSSGLPSVAVGHGVLLAGGPLVLEKKPEGSRAELRPLGDLAELVPDVPGDFVLEDASDRSLVIQSGRYDEMPLDCGRSDCHAAVAASVRESPMTRVLEADLGGHHALKSPECALACHTTGEPGTRDGGFSHVAEELGLVALPAEFAKLPRALRRLGGVGCLACHGPSRVPPETARWAVLRSDVCATCHDAPPRYGHVAAFATTSMARADRDPRTRQRPACARCHTTYGARAEPSRQPPADAPALGLGCTTCHEVHGKKPLRPTSEVCVSCHSPGDGPLPEASAAVLVVGRGGVEPATGAALDGPAPHASVPRGCLGCHGSGPTELERGRCHAFRVDGANCSPCHAEPPKRKPELAAAARALLGELVPLARGASRGSPPHAEALATAGLSPARLRAVRNALLVLEDPAADVHNPEYARQLLARSRTP